MQLHLNTYGAYLHVKDAMFDIRRKQEDGTWASAPGVAAHKVKSIWLGPGTALSSDAVTLALRHNIDIVFLENNGQPLGRVWHSRLGSTTRIRKCQLEASLDRRAMTWTCMWLAQKLENQAGFIRDLKKHRAQHQDFLSEKIEKIDAMRTAILALDAPLLDETAAGTLHGLEGTAGRLYFETLSFVLPSGSQFNGRSSRPAKDAFNAFLNYAYGVLYARVEKSLMLAGLDPYVGFLHRDDYNYKSLVYDFIEPYRAWADKVVFTLFSGKKVNQGHTDPIAGGFSLNAEGKKLLMEAYNDYLENDAIRYRGRNRTRATILLLDAHRFAQEMLGKNADDADLEIEEI
ncbi:MAG: CRISPR-associated endonuclease Cas1 [Saprospiraceae bacterium]|nr:CRISPR-associated endonuclease Cas1 [Saprospiraceae bacterium]